MHLGQRNAAAGTRASPRLLSFSFSAESMPRSTLRASMSSPCPSYATASPSPLLPSAAPHVSLPPPPPLAAASLRSPPAHAPAFPSRAVDLPSPTMDIPPASISAAGSASRDVARMPDSPPRRAARHRRAQSEILLGATTLPDDLAFDADLGVVGEVGGGGDDDDEEDEYEEDEERGGGGIGSGGSRMFEMFLEAGGRLAEPLEPAPYPPPLLARPRHQHSMSMDGSTALASAAAGMAGRAGADAKKAISDAKLAELALVDPKRAKRVLANRQSAARSKERKMRYIAELERKVQTLQTEATTLSTQLSMLQRDTSGLTSENSDLKLRVQTMEQQVRLQDALNDRLRDEVQQLKIATGQVNANGGKMGNFGLSLYGVNSQSHQRSHVQSLLAAQQLQQLQIHSQHQQPQMHLQQQHLSTVRQQQLLQEALPFPGELKMKGVATTSHVQNAGAHDSHALRSEL